MSDYVIGAITNYEWKDVEVWVTSLLDSGYSGKIAMMVFNSDLVLAKKLSDLGIEVVIPGKVENDRIVYPGQFNICIERFYCAYKFLSKVKDFNIVLMTDVKDVVFQKNPMHEVDNFFGSDGKISVNSENVLYRDEPWGINNMTNAFPIMYNRMAEKEIFNAGVVLGRDDEFLDFLLNVYMISKSSIYENVPGGGGPDQAALNILLSMKPWKKITYFSDMKDNYALQVGTILDPSKDFSKVQLSSVIPQLNRNVGGLVGFTNRLFSIIHQYDRNPELNVYYNQKFRGKY